MVLILFIYLIFLLFFLDYVQLRIIKFRPLDDKNWQIAFSETELFAKLDGRMAEVIMPAKPLIVRLYRKIFPLKGIKCEINI